uniref:Uncharacterized protein n=1 Tax=Arundo donax TaxID=35708 RepID=A0A0A9DI62_ARUDO
MPYGAYSNEIMMCWGIHSSLDHLYLLLFLLKECNPFFVLAAMHMFIFCKAPKFRSLSVLFSALCLYHRTYYRTLQCVIQSTPKTSRFTVTMSTTKVTTTTIMTDDEYYEGDNDNDHNDALR